MVTPSHARNPCRLGGRGRNTHVGATVDSEVLTASMQISQYWPPIEC